MFDEENNAVGTEHETVVEQALDQLPEAASEQQEAAAPVEQETAQAKNFRALREKAQRLERERDHALAQLNAKHQQPPEDDADDIGIAPDDLAEGKHLSKLNKKVRDMQKEMQLYKQQTQTVSAETRLKIQYPDIEKVVSQDNISQLNELYPELAHTLNANQDLYSKAVAAYTMIKKLGIHAEDTFSAERELAQKNAAKPKPLASVSPQQGDSPLSRANAFANGLTDELKEQLRKEMMEARRHI